NSWLYFFTIPAHLSFILSRLGVRFCYITPDRKFKRFLTCGRANISTELFLLCLGYNLKKLWAKCNAGRLKTHLFCVKKE
ncbi:MAG: hypothetical protein LKJ73_09500, partial [Oscillospiraceae bacterium]|nr:hypothetical protein [Oscillospiraceae bacterium]